MYSSVCSSFKHSTGVLCPTPRGSKPTMSKFSRNVSLTTYSAYVVYSIPEPPGPPGFKTSEPKESPVANFRIAEICIAPSDGFA